MKEEGRREKRVVEGGGSQGGRKLPMLFFSNPFLISGFETRGWQRVRGEKNRDKSR